MQAQTQQAIEQLRTAVDSIDGAIKQAGDAPYTRALALKLFAHSKGTLLAALQAIEDKLTAHAAAGQQITGR